MLICFWTILQKPTYLKKKFMESMGSGPVHGKHLDQFVTLFPVRLFSPQHKCLWLLWQIFYSGDALQPVTSSFSLTIFLKMYHLVSCA